MSKPISMSRQSALVEALKVGGFVRTSESPYKSWDLSNNSDFTTVKSEFEAGRFVLASQLNGTDACLITNISTEGDFTLLTVEIPGHGSHNVPLGGKKDDVAAARASLKTGMTIRVSAVQAEADGLVITSVYRRAATAELPEAYRMRAVDSKKGQIHAVTAWAKSLKAKELSPLEREVAELRSLLAAKPKGKKVEEVA